MNHKFENIETPQFIKNRYPIDMNDFICRKCIVCNFIVSAHIKTFDVFVFNNEEVYGEYVCYETLSDAVDISCEEFIIKNIIE
jgi:hypothetical protein